MGYKHEEIINAENHKRYLKLAIAALHYKLNNEKDEEIQLELIDAIDYMKNIHKSDDTKEFWKEMYGLEEDDFIYSYSDACDRQNENDLYANLREWQQYDS